MKTWLLVCLLTAPLFGIDRVKLEVGKFALETGLFNAAFAKEICSCVFVTKLTKPQCTSRDNLPKLAHLLVEIDVDTNKHLVTSSYRPLADIAEELELHGVAKALQVRLGPPATAEYVSEEYGCVLREFPVPALN